MVEPSDPHTRITESSNMDTSISETSNKKTRDFALILRPPSVLKKAVEALSNPYFNQKQQAMIQVGEYGFDITVRVIDPDSEKQIIGYLRLKATDLEEFQRSNPLQKMVSLRSVNLVLKDADKFNYDSVSIFSEDGSKKLSFQWDFGFGFPISIELKDVKPEHRKFPNVVTYGFEAVIPSKILTDTHSQVLQMRPGCRPTDSLATIKAPTVNIKLNDNVVLSTENKPELHEVWFNWQYWESLEKASWLADECSMYMVTNPPQNVMIRFNLDELGDLVFLIEAQFLTDNTLNDLPFLRLFRSLKIRRFFTKQNFDVSSERSQVHL